MKLTAQGILFKFMRISLSFNPFALAIKTKTTYTHS